MIASKDKLFSNGMFQLYGDECPDPSTQSQATSQNEGVRAKDDGSSQATFTEEFVGECTR